MQISRHPFLALLVSFCMLVSLTGCIPLWVGAGVAGIVGGYSVSPDTVEGTTNHSIEECWDSAKEIVMIMGHIVQESPNGTQLDANINGAKVTITMSAVNVSVTKISVKARKSFMPKIEVAQDVYSKILNRMGK